MTRKQFGQLIFHKDSVALVASIVFLWMAISLFVDSNMELKDLKSHSGVLVNIDSVITRVKDKPLFKEITKELHLTISKEEGYFSSITTNNFGDITSKLFIGDSITIYTKPKVLGVFGMKKKKDISQLTKGNIVIIAYEKYKKSILGLYILPLIGSIGFLFFYLNRITRRYNMDIREYT